MLSLADIKIYCRSATALSMALQIQRDLDALYSEVETDLLEIDLG